MLYDNMCVFCDFFEKIAFFANKIKTRNFQKVHPSFYCSPWSPLSKKLGWICPQEMHTKCQLGPRVVCVCVCLWVCRQIISKSSWPILMKLGRMMYNDKVQDPFEDGMNRSGRTHTPSIWNIKIAISYKVLGQTP